MSSVARGLTRSTQDQQLLKRGSTNDSEYIDEAVFAEARAESLSLQRELVTAPWDPTFVKSITAIEKTSLHSDQIKMLRAIVEYIQVDTFDYGDKLDDQNSGRKALISLVTLLLAIIRNSFGEHREFFTDLFFGVLERFEFDLMHVRPLLVRVAKFTRRQEVAMEQFREYQSVLVDIFKHASSQMQRAALASPHVTFATRTIAIALFRIPDCMDALLDALVDSCRTLWHERSAALPLRMGELDDQMESYWKRTLAEESEQLDDFRLSNPGLFQWGRVPPIRIESKILDPDIRDGFVTHLKKKLEGHAFFFATLNALVKHVNLMSHGDIPWTLVPGFRVLATWAFRRFLLLQPADWSLLSDSLVGGFPRISPLLPFCVQAVLRSTNVFNLTAVNNSIDILSQMLRATSLNPHFHYPIPAHFCFDEFLNAVSILLDSEEFHVLIKTLCLLYDHIGRFYALQRTRLVQNLLIERHFNRFFMHWNNQVREVYICILVFKVNRVGIYRGPITPTPVDLVQRSSVSDVPQSFEKRTFWRSLSSLFRSGSFPGSSTLKAPQLTVDEASDSRKIPRMVLSSPNSGMSQSPNHFSDSDDASGPRQHPQVIGMPDLKTRATPFSFASTCKISCDLDHDDEAQDHIIESNYLLFMRMLRQQLDDGNIEPTRVSYAKLALKEFKMARSLYKRLQTNDLQKFEVVSPMMAYNIVSVMSESV